MLVSDRQLFCTIVPLRFLTTDVRRYFLYCGRRWQRARATPDAKPPTHNASQTLSTVNFQLYYYFIFFLQLLQLKKFVTYKIALWPLSLFNWPMGVPSASKDITYDESIGYFIRTGSRGVASMTTTIRRDSDVVVLGVGQQSGGRLRSVRCRWRTKTSKSQAPVFRNRWMTAM